MKKIGMNASALLLFAECAVFVAACGDDGSGGSGGCTTGETESCTCTGTDVGVQICEADGTWAACDCGGGDTDADSDADTDTDTDAIYCPYERTSPASCLDLLGVEVHDEFSCLELTSVCCDVGGTADAGIDCVEGSYTIENSIDAELIEPYPCITGNLDINALGLTELDLPNLMYIGGRLWMGNCNEMTSLSLAGLVAVGGDEIMIEGAVLQQVDLGNLAHVPNGDLGISGAEIESIDLGSLEEVGGNMVISSTPLSSLALGQLTTVGGDFGIGGNGALESIYWDGLTTVGGRLMVIGNTLLPYCEVCELLDQLVGFSNEVVCSDNMEDECWDGGLNCP